MGDQDTRSDIRIRKPKPIKDLNLLCRHLLSPGAPFMVEAQEVQDPMDRHVRPMRRSRFTLRFGFMRHHRSANHQLAQKIPAVRAHPGTVEREHIGRPVTAPVAEIQAAAARRADHQDGQRGARGGVRRSPRFGARQRGTRPGRKLRAPRHPRPPRGVDHIEFERSRQGQEASSGVFAS